jgi:hypothetical protein
VRFRVKPGREQKFLDAHKKVQANWPSYETDTITDFECSGPNSDLLRVDENGHVAPWRLHDVRRTVATRMADLGIQPHVVEAVLNHVSVHKAGVAGTYNRSLYSPEKRAALDLWASHVLTLVGGAPDAGRVVMFPARAGGMAAECVDRIGVIQITISVVKVVYYTLCRGRPRGAAAIDADTSPQ